MNEQVFVIGHKNHDSDSIVGSIAFTELKKALGEDFVAVRNEKEIWPETVYLLDKFGFELPTYVESLEGKKVFLVDHNESGQYNTGVVASNVVGIVDHHKFNFVNEFSIPIINEPLGSSCTIMVKLYERNNVELSKNMAGFLMGAILSDTDNLKSPTTTKEDIDTVERLSELSGVEHNVLFSAMFEAQSDISKKTDLDLITLDFKLFENPKGTAAVGQVKVVDYAKINARKESMLVEMERLRVEKNVPVLLLMVTNIETESTDLWVVGDESIVKAAFGKQVKDNMVVLSGVMSRKKQIAPFLTKVLS